ncbi:hypothetical protein HYX17_02855 [Candidatus Woesearchaeota archaeon]|nr:hypothetical protein [Candidatus Woesearchaeota archaeon]
MRKIILDTDFLLTSLKFKVDVISEIDRICDFKYNIFIIDKTLDELKDKKLGKLALEIIKRFETIKTKKDKIADELILELNDKNIIVATQDKEFKKKLKREKIPIITIRQKKYLILQNVL